MNLGKVIKVTGLVLGGITALIGLFVFVALNDSRSTEDFAWVGLMLTMSGILEGVVLAGFGQIVDDVFSIKEKLCGSSTSYNNQLPKL